MNKIIKEKTVSKYQYTLRHWPDNPKPYILSRLDTDKTIKSKIAIRLEEVGKFKTLNEAELFMDQL